MVFWHPKGWALWRTLEAYMRRRLGRDRLRRGQDAAADGPRALGASGHWEKFRENMFMSEIDEDGATRSWR